MKHEIGSYQVGTHYRKTDFTCPECADRFYNEVDENPKYLAETDISGAPTLILRNTYGWKNDLRD